MDNILLSDIQSAVPLADVKLSSLSLSTDAVLTTFNAVIDAVNAIDISKLLAHIEYLSSRIDFYHSDSYDVNGTRYESLAEAIQAANKESGTIALLKDVSVSQTDSGKTLPAISNDIIVDGNNHTMTIDSSVKTANGSVFEFVNGSNAVTFKASVANSTGTIVKNITISSKDCTAVLAKNTNVQIENCSFTGSSTASYVKMGDSANCSMLSVTAENETGSIIEAATESESASFSVKGCNFAGSSDKTVTILKNSDTTKNTFTFDGGNYTNFNYPELNDNTNIVATYTGATEAMTDESLSAGLSSTYTFDNETVPEEFKTAILNQLLTQKPLKWFVSVSEDGNTFTINYKEPVKIPALSALLQLRQDVLDGNTYEDQRFVQTDDIDMEDLVSPNYINVAPHGIYWDGIGLKNGDAPDTDHCFKGCYDGNGKVIKNLRFANTSDNELYGLFRSVADAEIMNLSIYIGGDISGDSLANYRDSNNNPCDPSVTCITCNGFDPAVSSGKFGGAAFAGTAISGCAFENCAAFGRLGSADTPTKHTTAGILAYVTGTSADDNNRQKDEYVLDNVTNNIDIWSTRKVGGICGYGECIQRYDNVTNNGNITRLNGDLSKADDGVGGLIAYADNNHAGSIVSWQFSNVKNMGIVSADETLPNKWCAQIAGKAAAYHNGFTKDPAFNNWLSGENIVRADSQSFPGDYEYLRNHLYDLDLWYGETPSDDSTMVKLVKPEANKKYKVMVNYNISKDVTIPNAEKNPYPPLTSNGRIRLNEGEFVELDEELVSEDLRGYANVFCGDTAITGELVSGTTYKYQA